MVSDTFDTLGCSDIGKQTLDLFRHLFELLLLPNLESQADHIFLQRLLEFGVKVVSEGPEVIVSLKDSESMQILKHGQ